MEKRGATSEKPHGVSERDRWLFALGAVLALAGILLAGSFNFLDNHAWYWNVAQILCVITLLSGASGGFLVGRGLAYKRRKWLVALGGFLCIAWAVGGMLSFGLSFPSANYFSGNSYVNWDSYHGDYLVGWFHIRSLQLATLAGSAGGFATGFGMARKRSVQQ